MFAHSKIMLSDRDGWGGRQEIYADGKNVVPEVWEVLDKIKGFTEKVRCGEWKGATGEELTDVVAIGIGGSFLGPLFAHTALRCGLSAFIALAVLAPCERHCLHALCRPLLGAYVCGIQSQPCPVYEQDS